ncbi:hypothetical protein [Thiobacillus sp.]|jgi:hypothetical protein|uniref:hypothetical protein n=1 Tax=Thiobacillus sp. TaxID=924 RepID=UPI0025CD1424|nr:hypothetical protein [Thiobacillus sp.]
MSRPALERDHSGQQSADFLSLAAYGDEDHLQLSFGEFCAIDDRLGEVLRTIGEAAETLEVFAAVIGALARDNNPNAFDIDTLRCVASSRATRAYEVRDDLAALIEVLSDRSAQTASEELETLLKQLGDGE